MRADISSIKKKNIRLGKGSSKVNKSGRCLMLIFRMVYGTWRMYCQVFLVLFYSS